MKSSPLQYYLPLLILIILVTMVTSGCAPIIRLEQPVHSETPFLIEENSFGQTFLARYDGLQGISIYLESQGTGDGEILLNLFNTPTASTAIYTATLPLTSISSPGYYRFDFPPLEQSSLKSYYFELDVTGSGRIRLGSGPGNAYLNGSLYENGEPQNAQLSFRLAYHPLFAVRGLAGEAITWIWYGLLFLFLFIVPGWAALRWLNPIERLGTVERLGLAIGLGLALYPLLYLWADVIGIPINSVTVLIVPILSIGVIVFRVRYRSSRIDLPDRYSLEDFKTWLKSPERIADLALAITLGLIAFTRFWPVWSLDAPMWGDSYQHTLISQLLVDNQGLFRSWEPYTELQSFTYHFGFHSLVAAFHSLTDLDLPKATLWIGQMVNFLAVISLYPLAVKVGGNRWSGILAILIAGLLSPMPMAYVNWGRYTQLAGQAILPVAVWLIWSNIKSRSDEPLEASNGSSDRRVSFKWGALMWVLLAGLFLTHYRVLIFLFTFYFVLFILEARKPYFLRTVKIFGLHFIGAFLLSLPWVLRLFDGKLPEILGGQVSTVASPAPQAIQQFEAIGNLAGYQPIFLWILFAAAFIFALFKRSKASLMISSWWLLIFILANLNLIGLPGSELISNFAVFIAVYIPCGILVGVSASTIIPRAQGPAALRALRLSLPKGLKLNISVRFLEVFVLVTCVGLGLWGARARLSQVSPAQFALVTRPDVQASEWIRENVSENAKFLVNSFFAYQNTLVVGSDAGWWLPLLAGRKTTLPPINYVTEKEPQPGYVNEVNHIVEVISSNGIHDPDVMKELQDLQVTHVFIGQGQGRVNGPPLLDAQTLLGDPGFQTIYHQDRVWIFEILYPE